MKLYVGTYNKYNNGSLDGRWIDLNNFECKQDFLTECYRLHADETDAELMFQDCEYYEDWESDFYCECYINDEYWKVKAELERTGLAEDVFSAWYNLNGGSVISESVTKCLDEYRGQYASMADYVEHYFNDMGIVDEVPAQLRGYVDFAQIARDWENSGELHCVCGYIFEDD